MKRITRTKLSFSEHCQWTLRRPEAMPPCRIKGTVPTRYELVLSPDGQQSLIKQTVALVATVRMRCMDLNPKSKSCASAGSILNILWAPRDGVPSDYVWCHGFPAQRAAASRQVLCWPQGEDAGLSIDGLLYCLCFAGWTLNNMLCCVHGLCLHSVRYPLCLRALLWLVLRCFNAVDFGYC